VTAPEATAIIYPAGPNAGPRGKPIDGRSGTEDAREVAYAWRQAAEPEQAHENL
jgi:hypothetical protein